MAAGRSKRCGATAIVLACVVWGGSGRQWRQPPRRGPGTGAEGAESHGAATGRGAGCHAYWKLPKVPEGPRSARPGRRLGQQRVAGRSRLTRAGATPVLASAGLAGQVCVGARVRVLAHRPPRRLGLYGVVFTVSSAGLGGGLADVALDYSKFADRGWR